MYKCKVCGEIFETKQRYGGHMGTHNKNKPKIKCEHCGKEFSIYGIKNHIAIVHDKIRSNPIGYGVSWNKGLTADTDSRVKYNRDCIKAHYLVHLVERNIRTKRRKNFLKL